MDKLMWNKSQSLPPLNQLLSSGWAKMLAALHKPNVPWTMQITHFTQEAVVSVQDTTRKGFQSDSIKRFLLV